MPFPTVPATTDGNAQAAFQSAASAAGLQLNNLNTISQLQLVIANLLDYDPTTSDVPAGNIVPGTFAANTANPTGAFAFAGVVSVTNTTEATTGPAGALVVSGGGYFAKKVFSIGDLTVGSSAFVVTAATGAVAMGNAAINGAAASYRSLSIQTAALTRWAIIGTNDAESGANAGTDFGIFRYSDAGSFLANALSITRATGAVTIAGNLTVGSSAFVVTAATGAVASGVVSATKTDAPQAVFSGYSTVGGARAGSGAIKIGNAAGVYGLLQYDDSGQTAMYLDNCYDGASSALKIRMRTLGTPVDALTILGTGAATFASSLAITGALTGVTEFTASGAGIFKGAVTAHQTSAIVLAQDSSVLSVIRCYGADAATAGTLAIHLMANDGSPDVNALSFASTGAATFAGQIISTTGNDTTALTTSGATTGYQLISLVNGSSVAVFAQCGTGTSLTSLLNSGGTAYDVLVRGSSGIVFSADGGGKAHARIAATAAGETGLLVYDHDNGQLERVTVGAPDSGGSGYKVLRIPN